MKYITISEADPYSNTCANVGTLGFFNVEQDLTDTFVRAIEAHFDAKMVSYRFEGEINALTDCINAVPIDAWVELEGYGEVKVELAQTWLYND